MQRDGRLNDENWQRREDQKTDGWVQVRDSEVKLGGRYQYRGRSAITPSLIYDAKVIKITRHLFILDVKARKNDESLGEPIGYSIAIPRIDLGKSERLYKRVETEGTE